MWWEILPSAAIVYALLIAPHGVHWAENKIRTGRSHARMWQKHRMDYMMYLRDRRITGSEYKPQGLEVIPEVD